MNIECHHCSKKGHIKRFCLKLKKENKKNKGKEDTRNDKDDEVYVVVTIEHFLIVLVDDDNVNFTSHECS